MYQELFHNTLFPRPPALYIKVTFSVSVSGVWSCSREGESTDVPSKQAATMLLFTPTHTYTHRSETMSTFIASDERFSLQVSMTPPWEDQYRDGRAVLRGCVQFNKYTHVHTHSRACPHTFLPLSKWFHRCPPSPTPGSIGYSSRNISFSFSSVLISGCALFPRVHTHFLLKQAALRADPSLATSRHINRSAFPMDGWTPLHAAAARGNLEFVKVTLVFACAGGVVVKGSNRNPRGQSLVD